MARKTDLLAELREAKATAAVCESMLAAEQAVLGPQVRPA
jgi:hypothetical protein